MKKALVVLICLLFLNGCSLKSKEVPPIPNLNFTGNMSISYKYYSMECTVVSNLASGLYVTVVRPEILSGLKLYVENGICKIEYGSVSYNLDPDMLLQTDFVTYVSEAFESIKDSTSYTKLDNSYWKYTGKIKSGEFIFLQDAVTGYPVSLRIPDADLTIKFNNIKPMS